MASYGPSFVPSFYGPSAKRMGHENKEGKNEDPLLAVQTEQTTLIRCLLYGFVGYSGKRTKSFNDLLTGYQELEVCMATYVFTAHGNSQPNIITSNILVIKVYL